MATDFERRHQLWHERQTNIAHEPFCDWCRWQDGKLYSLGADGWKPALLSDGSEVLS